MTRTRRLSAIERADLGLAKTVAVDGRTREARWLDRFAELGDQPPLRILCAAVVAAGVAGGDRRLFRTGLRMALAHSLATAAKSFVKDGVDRTRPNAALDGNGYRLTQGRSSDHALQSMPSGHSAGVIAVAGAAIADYPQAALPVAAASATLLGAQLPSRNHFLTDILAGGAIGLASVALARRLLPPDAEG